MDACSCHGSWRSRPLCNWACLPMAGTLYCVIIWMWVVNYIAIAKLLVQLRHNIMNNTALYNTYFTIMT
jgi:hypothetical protein